MTYTDNVVPSKFEAQYAVSTLLSHYGPHDVVSTRAAIKAIRVMAPLCRTADDDLVALIVSAATGRTMTVAFDHRAT